jgi:RNA polymerase sigma-70 factor (ECF subfamily)
MSSLEVKFRPDASAGSTAHRGLPIRADADDDARLIRRAQAGRWEAFAEVAGHYDRAILALALRLTGSEREARELFQQALVRAYRELGGYRFQCSFYLWIYRIVARSFIEFLSKQSSAAPAEATELEAALKQLSPRERVVLELKQYFGLKLDTIAAILGVTEQAARNIFLRAILELRLELHEPLAANTKSNSGFDQSAC